MNEHAPGRRGDALDWLHERGMQRSGIVPEFDVEETLLKVREVSQLHATGQGQHESDAHTTGPAIPDPVGDRGEREFAGFYREHSKAGLGHPDITRFGADPAPGRWRGVRYRVLGPLEVRAVTGERISIDRPKHRQLIATLLLSHNVVVTTDQLIGDLWEDGPPSTARGLLKTYIWGLRRLLSPRDPNVAPIETLVGGCRMLVDTNDLDLLVFSELAREGRDLLRSGHLDAADDVLQLALSMWRGPVLQGVPKSWSLIDAAASLDEERLNAVEDWAEVRLMLGRHVDVAAHLRPWARANPLRERLWGQLMLALYRSGRRVEALQVFHELRRGLDDELGIAPSAPVRELHEQILLDDPALLVPGSASLNTRAPGSTSPAQR